MGGIELALRERLEMGGCYALDRDAGDPALWFTPHLNGRFALPRAVTTAEAANAVLRSAGMEEVF